MRRRPATSHGGLNGIPTVLSDVQPASATAALQQPPQRAPEVHLVGMRVEVGVPGRLLLPERLELGAPRARIGRAAR